MPLVFPALQDEPLYIPYTANLLGDSHTAFIKPQGVEPFKLERVNCKVPGEKIGDTLPAGFIFPKVKIRSVSRNPFTYDIDSKTFLSPMASNQWTGGVRIDAKFFGPLRVRTHNLQQTCLLYNQKQD